MIHQVIWPSPGLFLSLSVANRCVAVFMERKWRQTLFVMPRVHATQRCISILKLTLTLKLILKIRFLCKRAVWKESFDDHRGFPCIPVTISSLGMDKIMIHDAHVRNRKFHVESVGISSMLQPTHTERKTVTMHLQLVLAITMGDRPPLLPCCVPSRTCGSNERKQLQDCSVQQRHFRTCHAAMLWCHCPITFRAPSVEPLCALQTGQACGSVTI